MPKTPITPFRLLPAERKILDEIAAEKGISRKAVVVEGLRLLEKKLLKKRIPKPKKS